MTKQSINDTTQNIIYITVCTLPSTPREPKAINIVTHIQKRYQRAFINLKSIRNIANYNTIW
jgi:hypothetical protein